MAAPKTLPRSWWANSSWSRGGAQLVDDDLHRLGNVNHYPGRSSDFGRLSLESLRRNIRGWWDYHVNARGWSDIGYQTAIAMTEDGPVIVDLRGIGRVPAAHASTSNPRANWHGGATLWLIGNTEPINNQLIDAYRWYRTEIWLPRWPSATGVTHHRRVPGAQTLCAGDIMDRLVRSGTLKEPPQEDDMSTNEKIKSYVRPDGDETVEHALATTRRDAYRMRRVQLYSGSSNQSNKFAQEVGVRRIDNILHPGDEDDPEYDKPVADQRRASWRWAIERIWKNTWWTLVRARRIEAKLDALIAAQDERIREAVAAALAEHDKRVVQVDISVDDSTDDDTDA